MKYINFWFCLLLLVSFLSEANTPLSKNDIHFTQKILWLKGMYDGYLDGIDGPLTQRAILRYEEQLGDQLTGKISTDNLIKRMRLEMLSGLQSNDLKKALIESRKKQTILEKEISNLKKTVQQLQNKETSRNLSNNVNGTAYLVSLGSSFAMGILAIVLTIMGIAGLAVYKTIKFKIEEEQKKLYADRSIRIKASIYMILSSAFYLFYREFFETTENYKKHAGYKNGVNLSLWFCDRTFENIKMLNDKVEENLLIKIATANKSYHLATRQEKSDIDTALRNVNIIEEYAKELSRDGDIKTWAKIQETLAWIYIRSKQRYKEVIGKKIISEILHNNDLDQEFKDEISENYKKLGIKIDHSE